MYRRFSLALVAIVSMVATLVVATPAAPANAVRVSGNTYYFNNFEQGVIATSGVAYFAARWGCGPICSMATTAAFAYLLRNGVCPGGRYLRVTIIGVPVWISCVYLSGVGPTYGYQPTPAGGNGGGGSWRMHDARS